MSEHEHEPDEQGDAIEDVPTPPAGEPTPEEEEAEHDEETHDEDGTEQPPLEQPQALSEKDIEKRNQALDKEAIRHAKRVAEIVGDDIAMLLPCELCAPIIPGFRFPHIPDDQRAATLLAIGMADAGNLLKAPDAEKCEDCGGKGLLRTGSFVKGQETVTCRVCNARGWVGDRAVAFAQPVPSPQNGETEVAPVQPVPLSSEVEEHIRAAEAAGMIVIRPSAPAVT